VVNKQEPLVRRWIEWNSARERHSWETPRQLELRIRGLSFRGNEVLEGDQVTRLAEFVYEPGGRGIVRLTLPNQMTIRRHRMIRRIAESMDVRVLITPRSVIDQADIDWSSIEIIDTAETEEPFRAAEQLIRAHVRVYTGTRMGRDFWGRWIYSAERDAYFLSGFDRNERRLSYFFCELPPGVEPRTVAEAYQALKPPSVVAAEDQRRRVLRQGDMFMIRMPRDFYPAGDYETRQYVHSTNHMADLYARTDDGLVFVSRNLRHRPVGRRADHKTLHLGRRWYLCVKNTVPVTR